MKKICLVMLFLIIANLAFISAVDSPNAGVGEGDVEELKGIIDQLPFDDSGKADFNKYKPFRTRAEERIDKINTWLDDNVGWMRYLFHMRPQVSILFALNLYFILFFFLILVLNAKALWFFVQSGGRATLFGAGTFVIFAALGLYAGLASIANNFAFWIWYILFDVTLWLAIIAMVIFLVLLIFAPQAVKAILQVIRDYFKAKEAFKEKTEMATNSESVKKIVEQLTKK